MDRQARVPHPDSGIRSPAVLEDVAGGRALCQTLHAPPGSGEVIPRPGARHHDYVGHAPTGDAAVMPLPENVGPG